jgi:sporulation protein YlmC with PRC-barrel domain
MTTEKRTLKELIGRMIVTKEGKRLGLVLDITFEARTGELIHIVIKDPTPYARSLNLEKTQKIETLIPYNSIVAIGDFVVVSEEDLI